MLGQRDLPLYLVAIKSFLRWYPNVAVVAHSDGTLYERDEATMSRHIPGCKVVTASEADALACSTLGADSYLFKCRSWDASYRRVIDTHLWSKTGKRIIMDSDILVLRRPHEIIEWIETHTAPFLFGQPPSTEATAPSPGGKKHIQTIFREKVGDISRKLGLTNAFPQGATSGFYGCTEKELALEKLERIIRVCSEIGIPMREWGSEQCIVIYLLASAGGTRLNPDLYLNFDFDQVEKLRNAHAVHFLGYCRYYMDLYPRLAAEIVGEWIRHDTVLI